MKTPSLLRMGTEVLVLCTALTLRAGTTWTGSGGNADWHTAANWSGGVPVSGTTAIFGAAGPNTITLAADGIAARLRQRFDGLDRMFTIASGAATSASLTLEGTAAELIDAVSATAGLTFDGTPNANGARLSLVIQGNKPIPLNGGVSISFNLDISGSGSLNLAAGTSGTGTLVLGGINSYSGNTTVVSGGTVSLLDDARLTFYIGANGVNNSISGAGAVLLDGDFDFDLTGADLTNGNSWNIVNVGTLAEVFGPTFTVLGFTELNDVWTKSDGPNQWTFSEGTGMLELTVVPEPCTFTLGLLGGLGLWGAFWRRQGAAL